jgi:hypothetical protein
MSDTKRPIVRTSQSDRERQIRSELRKILNSSGVLHGTLIERQRVCGKPNCKCMRGQKHRGLYLVVTEGGKPRQLYVPKDWEQTVRRWVQDYQKARELMEEVSRIHWQKVRERQD